MSFRSGVLALTLALVLSCNVAPAQAATGIRALDNPAIAVKAPDRVNLIAIARAGTRLVAAGEHGVIAYSDDNGLTWTQSSVPVTVTLTCVAFANARDGWAAGHYGVILHTTDGGASWQLQLNGIQANQLTLDAANAAVAANKNDEAAQRALRRANFFMSAGPDKPFLSIWAASPQNALVFGAYRMLMKTTDAGETWADRSQQVDDPLSHNLYDVTVVGTDLFVAGEIGLVFRSNDSGNSFAEVTSPGGATLLGAVATGDNGVMVFGIAGQAFRSDDNGNSWTPVAVNTQASLIAARTMSSGAIVLVSEDGSVYISTDHAHRFELLTIEPMALYDLVQASSGDLVTVGNLGVARDFCEAT